MLLTLFQAATATATSTTSGISMRDVAEVIGLLIGAVSLVVGAFKLGTFSQKADALEERSITALKNLTQRVDDGFGVMHKRFDTFDAYVDDSTEIRKTWEGRASRWDARHDATEKETDRIRQNLNHLRTTVDDQLKDHEKRISRIEPRSTDK